MSSTVFTNGVTLTDAAWFNDVDSVTYDLFGNGTSYTGALTLGSSGNIAVNTNKFTVAASSGNTVIAGTLNVTGATTLTAAPILSALTASQAVFTDGSKGLVSNAITGSGNVVMSASPTLSGTIGGALTFSGALTLSSALTYGGVTLSNAVTGTGNMVLSASPTLTGTLSAAAISASGYAGIAGGGTTTAMLEIGGTMAAISGAAKEVHILNAANPIVVIGKDATDYAYMQQVSGSPSYFQMGYRAIGDQIKFIDTGLTTIGGSGNYGLAVNGTVTATGNITLSGNGPTITGSGSAANGYVTIASTNSDVYINALAASRVVYLNAGAGGSVHSYVGGSAITTVSSTGLSVTGTIDSTDAITITKSANAPVYSKVVNSNAGAAAAMAFWASNGTKAAEFGTLGTGYTTNGVLVASRGYIATNDNLAIYAAGTIYFAAGSTTQVGAWSSTGLSVTGTLAIGATKQLYLDGGGDTYIYEESANKAVIVVGGGAGIEINATAGASRIPSGLRIGADSTNNLLDDASNGAGTATLYIGNASINVTSDERIKTNIREWDGDALAILKALPVKAWDAYTRDAPIGGYEGGYVGFTAQDMHKVAPWSVNTQGSTGLPWQARYEFLNGIIVKGMQQVTNRLDKLERDDSRIADLLAWKAKAETALAKLGISV